MSQKVEFGLDPASQAGAGRLVDVTTDDVPAAQRQAFWRDGVLKRMVPVASPEESRPFRARLRRVTIEGAELVEHASDSILAVRTAQRRRLDGCDDVSVDLMRECEAASIDHKGEHRLRPGDLCVVDYAQPVQVRRSRHRASGMILSRQRVSAAMGGDVSELAGSRIPGRGLAAVLRHHLQSTIDEAPRMSATQRWLAVETAAEMTLAVLQAARRGAADVEQFTRGFYQAARALIVHECHDPDLTPPRIAARLGCSRASLYRAFAAHDRSVAECVWQARIERAWRLLTSSSGVGMLVSDVAFACGFREQPTFTRMFKRRYGITPREAREMGSLND